MIQINKQSNNEKIFVEMLVRFDKEGNIWPLSVLWDNGKAYAIDKIIDKRRAASLKAGGIGLRYTVKIRGKITYLYYEEPKWYMENL